ncbi:MAG: hypothetical protein ACLUSL_09515 [Ruminococcus sp.]
MLELLGRKRGMLISGGEVNLERAAITLLDRVSQRKAGTHHAGTSGGGMTVAEKTCVKQNNTRALCVGQRTNAVRRFSVRCG